jgi:hypothetical protein
MTTPITEVTNTNQGFESTEYSKGTKTVGATFYGEAEDQQSKSLRDKQPTKQLSDAAAQAALDSALKSGAGAVGTSLNKLVATKATPEEIEQARKNGTLGEGHDVKGTIEHSKPDRPASKEEIEEARKNGTLGRATDSQLVKGEVQARPATREEVDEARKNGTLGTGSDSPLLKGAREARPATKEEIEEYKKNGTLGRDSAANVKMQEARPATAADIEAAKKNGSLDRNSAPNLQPQEALPATAQDIEDARKNGTLGQGHDIKDSPAPNEEVQKLLQPYGTKDNLMWHRKDRPPTSDPNDTFLPKDRSATGMEEKERHMGNSVKGSVAPEPPIIKNGGSATKAEAPAYPEPNW